jgi:hypothetical protein
MHLSKFVGEMQFFKGLADVAFEAIRPATNLRKHVAQRSEA